MPLCVRGPPLEGGSRARRVDIHGDALAGGRRNGLGSPDGQPTVAATFDVADGKGDPFGAVNRRR